MLNWLFPIACAGCGLEGYPLCRHCMDTMELGGEGGFCFLQGQKLASTGGASAGDELDGLASVFIYIKNGTLAGLLHLYKYELIEAYGMALAEAWRTRIPAPLLATIEHQIDLITWIPLHHKKFQRRGFNQSRTLAMAIPLTIPKISLLVRRKNSKAQMTLTRTERFLNVENAFELNPAIQSPVPPASPLANDTVLSGKTILLIDDVITTGATLHAAAKVLKGAGAARVYGLVLARQEE